MTPSPYDWRWQFHCFAVDRYYRAPKGSQSERVWLWLTR